MLGNRRLSPQDRLSPPPEVHTYGVFEVAHTRASARMHARTHTHARIHAHMVTSGPSAKMDPQVLYRTLEGTFNADGNIRSEAEKHLRQAESMSGYLGIIFQVACAPEVQVDVRLAAAIRFKNKLHMRDWNADDSPVTPDETNLIKKAIVQAIISAPSRVRAVLLEGMKSVLKFDYPEKWPGLVQEVVHYLQGQEMDKISGALSVLRVMVKTFEFTADDEDRKPLEEGSSSR